MMRRVLVRAAVQKSKLNEPGEKGGKDWTGL